MNKETELLDDWLREQKTYRHFQKLSMRMEPFKHAIELKTYVQELSPLAFESNNVFKALLKLSLDRVDWLAIAEGRGGGLH
ncbi:hypothetical protein ACFL20_10105 [Spirochaetota bacterium]